MDDDEPGDHTADSIEKLYWRLADRALLDRPDLQESLAQMRRGEGEIVA
jgi:hypothetical protein